MLPLEKHADFLIADHALPKIAPLGSISWKFIEDSVKNSELEDPDFHRIGRNPDVPRAVGSIESSKKTRTRFTHTDDALLTEWVLHNDSRNAERGNLLYQQFGNLVSQFLARR